MSDLNQCTFTGRLGRDPETRTFPSGDLVANVSIAVSETWKDKQTGERKERTEWVSLTFSGKLADVASQYLRKGSQVAVSGKLRTRKWQDRETGQDRYATEIMVNHMTMIGGKQDGPAPAPAAAPSSTNQRPAAAPISQSHQSAGSHDDSDIPF